MSAEPSEFDSAAAWLRRANGDMKAFLAALAARLETALPGSVDVERRRDGFLAKTSHVAKITVRFESSSLTLEFERGRLRATRAKVVRGVTIRSEDIAVPVWIDDVVRNARQVGEHASAAHGGLHEFLMS